MPIFLKHISKLCSFLLLFSFRRGNTTDNFFERRGVLAAALSRCCPSLTRHKEFTDDGSDGGDEIIKTLMH